MIEKLPDWPDGPVNHEHQNEKMLWRKLNEVIEAVNKQEEIIDGLQTVASMLVDRSLPDLSDHD